MSIVKNKEKLQTTENVEKLTLTRHYHKTKRKLYIKSRRKGNKF